VVDSKVKVCNLALSFLNQGLELKDFETDQTVAARQCRNFFEAVEGKILRDYLWPRNRTRLKLAKVACPEDSIFSRAYREPSNSVKFRGFVYPGMGMYDEPSLSPQHEISGDEAGALILTNEDCAVGEFIVRRPVPQWSDDFTLCFSLLLASYLAPTITGGDQMKLGERALQRYMMDAPKAAAAALAEESAKRPMASGFERIR
jgi:hypothetical protein